MTRPHDRPLRFEPAVGQEVRVGDWHAQGESTYRLAHAAVEDGDFATAAELGRYTVEEAQEAHDLYRQWIAQLRGILVREGVPGGVVDDEESRILAALGVEGAVTLDPDEGWRAYQSEIARFEDACRRSDGKAALDRLERARRTWQSWHDPICDWVYGLIDAAARHLGEHRIGDVWDELMAEGYRFYERYDIDRNPWEESFKTIMHVLFQGMRGHLSGPGRLGDLEVIEEHDRWGVRFDPCGSGGRTYRGDANGPPRMMPPFNYSVTTEPHDWAWNKKGVCLYCVHCCQLMERHPIRAFGYPVRVVDPPTWPEAAEGGSCTWWVYKDPSLVPDAVYERVGERRPSRLGSAARRAADEAIADDGLGGTGD